LLRGTFQQDRLILNQWNLQAPYVCKSSAIKVRCDKKNRAINMQTAFPGRRPLKTCETFLSGRFVAQSNAGVRALSNAPCGHPAHGATMLPLSKGGQGDVSNQTFQINFMSDICWHAGFLFTGCTGLSRMRSRMRAANCMKS
jgi:hypothetical protein